MSEPSIKVYFSKMKELRLFEQNENFFSACTHISNAAATIGVAGVSGLNVTESDPKSTISAPKRSYLML